MVISSARGEKARREGLEAFAAGQVEMLLMAPEQFANPEVLEQVEKGRPSLLVVDEAHCVSEWGHSFRPDYLLIGSVVERLHHPRVLALTATAAPPRAPDIAERLAMRDPAVIVGEADRPDIWLGARLFAGNRERDEALVEAATAIDGALIVYAPTHRRRLELAGALSADGRPATSTTRGCRHGSAARRPTRSSKGRAQTIVATNAFGMGVDRPDVRAVLHAGPPPRWTRTSRRSGAPPATASPGGRSCSSGSRTSALGRYLESGGASTRATWPPSSGCCWRPTATSAGRSWSSAPA